MFDSLFTKYKWFVVAQIAIILLCTILCLLGYDILLSLETLLGGTIITAMGAAAKFLYHKYIEPDYTPSILELLDGIISGGIKKQLLAYIVLIAVSIAVICSLAILTGDKMLSEHSISDKIWRVVWYFFESGEVDTNELTTVKIAAIIIALIGMVLMGGMLVSTLSNIIERRVERVERGEMTYSSINHHYVIIGYSNITLCIIRKIYKGADLATAPKLIILSIQDVSHIHGDILSQLPAEYENKIIIYSGSIESEEQIERLNIAQAKEVYVLGEQSDEYGRDVKSLECVRIISKLRGTSVGKKLLRVNVQIDRIPSYSIIQKINMQKQYLHHTNKNGKLEESPNIYFRPFNFHESWARLLWSYHKDERYDNLNFEAMGDDKYVHLVIIGFNRMGRALLLEALRICHYANYVEANPGEGIIVQNRTKITIIDREIDRLAPFFETQYPYLDQIKDIEIEYINNSIESRDVREMLDRAAHDENKLLTVAVCIKDPDLGLSMGLNLPESLYSQPEKIIQKGRSIAENNTRPRVLIYQEMLKGIGDIVSNDKKRYRNVKIFGMLNEGVNDRLLDDRMSMCVAALYNDTINRIAGVQKGENFVGRLYQLTVVEGCRNRELIDEIFAAMEVDWATNDENTRWANRYQIDIYNNYIAELASYGITSYGQINKMTSNQIRRMSQMEHMRWSAERSVMGWRQAKPGELRNDDILVHNLIIPFYEMRGIDINEAEEEKDRAVIKNVLQLNSIFNALGLK